MSKILNISLVTKILKKSELYKYSLYKWLYIKEILMKIDIYLKMKKLFTKYMKILEKAQKEAFNVYMHH